MTEPNYAEPKYINEYRKPILLPRGWVIPLLGFATWLAAYSVSYRFIAPWLVG